MRSCTRRKEPVYREDLSYKNYCDMVQYKLNTKLHSWLDNSTSTADRDKLNSSGQQLCIAKPPLAALDNSQVIGRLASASGSPVSHRPDVIVSRSSIDSPIKKKSFEIKPAQKNHFTGKSLRDSSKGGSSSRVRIVATDDTIAAVKQENVTEFLQQEMQKKAQPAWVDRLS